MAISFGYHTLCLLTILGYVFCISSGQRYVHIPGEFMLGGLFPVHFPDGDKCGIRIDQDLGIYLLDAAIFALKEVNGFLKKSGISLGLVAYDTCYNINPSLQHSLELQEQSYYTQHGEFDNSSCTSFLSRRVIGVIGPVTSKESQIVASLFDLFKMPQISATATSSVLNDKQKYKYFKRTVPSDTHQAKGIVQLLRHFGWQYVNILYEDSSYGSYGYRDIKTFAPLENICIGYEKQISENIKDAKITEIVNEIKSRRNLKGKIVVVLFMLYQNAYRVIHHVHRMQLENIIWIGSDGITGRDPPYGLERIMNGAIGLTLETLKYPGFSQYINNRTIQTNPNPWYEDYLNQYFPNCSAESCGRLNGTEFPYVSNMRDTVYAYGYALLNMHSDMCQNLTGVCKKMKGNLTGDLMTEYLERFKDPFNTSFHFVDGVEGPARYSILQYIRKSDSYEWIDIGKFVEDNLKLNVQRIDGETASCSASCGKGYIKRITETCCWECTPCPAGAISNSSNSYVCVNCPIGFTSNVDRNECIKIAVSYFTYDNPFSIAILVLCMLGFLLCLAVSVVVVKTRNTPLLKATGFETSIVLLVSILLSYSSPLVLLSKPTSASCALARLFIGMSYTLAYSSVLSKLIVYKRAFDVRAGIKQQALKGQNVPRPYICTMKTALLLSLALSAVQLVAIIFWMIVDNPEQNVSYDGLAQQSSGHRACRDSSDFSYFLLLFWPFMLMIACLVFAIKTRKLPEGMNDSREIMYCSFTSSVIWLAFVPLYAFSGTAAVRVISLCVSLFIHATVFLACLFLTKIYIVIFRPEKNNRERVMRSNATNLSKSQNSCDGTLGKDCQKQKNGDKPHFDKLHEEETVSYHELEHEDIQKNANTSVIFFKNKLFEPIKESSLERTRDPHLKNEEIEA